MYFTAHKCRCQFTALAEIFHAPLLYTGKSKGHVQPPVDKLCCSFDLEEYFSAASTIQYLLLHIYSCELCQGAAHAFSSAGAQALQRACKLAAAWKGTLELTEIEEFFLKFEMLCTVIFMVQLIDFVSIITAILFLEKTKGHNYDTTLYFTPSKSAAVLWRRTAGYLGVRRLSNFRDEMANCFHI